MMRADSASAPRRITPPRFPAIIARNFLRTLMTRPPFITLCRLPAVLCRLQPRLRGRGAAFPTDDVVHVLEGHADIVEPFEEPRAIRRRYFESDIRAARAADALRRQIDRKRRGAVGGDDAGDES